jgi:hypothetical protein
LSDLVSDLYRSNCGHVALSARDRLSQERWCPMCIHREDSTTSLLCR